VDALESKAKHLHVMASRNAKRVGDVDKTRKGLFLFNYFVANDAEVMMQLWDYLADWYQVETGLDNSTLFVPLGGEKLDYVAINHARWETVCRNSCGGSCLKRVSGATCWLIWRRIASAQCQSCTGLPDLP
jgi:hypothetical protein